MTENQCSMFEFSLHLINSRSSVYVSHICFVGVLLCADSIVDGINLILYAMVADGNGANDEHRSCTTAHINTGQQHQICVVNQKLYAVASLLMVNENICVKMAINFVFHEPNILRRSDDLLWSSCQAWCLILYGRLKMSIN